MEEAEILLTVEERTAFLALEKDYQRDAFIQRFWAVRDTNRRTAKKEFRERWEANAQLARDTYHDLADAPDRILLVNGRPAERVESNCALILGPLEGWFYLESDRVKEPFAVV